MGGAVSSGQDNDELIDNLKQAGYIKTPEVERVFRVVDRAHYYLPECRDSAYKDLAWKSGTLHLSAPCIYSEVMEALELREGLSFLNLGSGTGYLNTMVGFMIGPYGINHGIELHTDNVAYANKKLESFIQTSKKFDDLELCEPQFVVGNCLNLAPENRLYDRVYCGASCPSEKRETIQSMIKVNGILVIPVGDQLLKIKRISETEFTSENVLPVSFASLVLPGPSEANGSMIVLPDVNPLSLQCLCRIIIRSAIRATFDFKLPAADEMPLVNKVKHVKAAKFFRSEAGRHPLNILPTAQGLMLLAAFDSSDEDEDDGNETSRERSISSILDLNQQLRRHASELRARERSSNNETGDVDTDLSDMEDEGIQISHIRDVNGNKNSSLVTSSNSHMDTEDGNMEDAEENDVWKAAPRPYPESVGRNGSWARSSLRKSSEAVCSSVEGTKDSAPIVSESSTYQLVHNDVTSEFNKRSPAIQVTPSGGVSVPHATRESYSTSADTSETSGFGSLGDDTLHISSQRSGLGSLKDDMEICEDFLPAFSSPASNNKRSPQSKSSIGESSVDYDSLTADSADNAWIDTDDDDDDDDHQGECKSKRIKNVEERKVSNKEGRNNEDNAGDDDDSSSEKGPDFSAFLRMKVDTLPIPSSLKAFILHYRQARQENSFRC